MTRRRGSGRRATKRPTSHRHRARATSAPSGAAAPAGARRMPWTRYWGATTGPSPTDERTHARLPTDRGGLLELQRRLIEPYLQSAVASDVRVERSGASSDGTGPSSSSARRASGARSWYPSPTAPGGAATRQRGQAGSDLVPRVRGGVLDPRCPSLDVLHRPRAGALRAAGPGLAPWTNAREPHHDPSWTERGLHLPAPGRSLGRLRSTSATRTGSASASTSSGTAASRGQGEAPRRSSGSSGAPAHPRPADQAGARSCASGSTRSPSPGFAPPRTRATTASSRCTWSRASATSPSRSSPRRTSRRS